MADVFVGLDLGTTGIKAVAFDDDQQPVASATAPTPTRQLASGGAEYDADELWQTACHVLSEVTATLASHGHRAVAVATASMGESGVLVDGGGNPLAPIIAWFDQRTLPQVDWWQAHVGVERTQRMTGLTPRPVFGATKMLWTRSNLRDAWDSSVCWLNMADWIAFKLCGQMATDLSLASRTMLLDVANRTWSSELLEASSLDAGLLAPLVPSGQALGHVLAASAAQTGLPTTAVVGAGGQDHVCAALALDVTAPGMLLDSIGTAEAFFLVTDDFDATGRVASTGISQGVHVAPNQTYAMTGIAPGGGRIDEARIASGLAWDDFMTTAAAQVVIDQLATEGQDRIELLLGATGASVAQHIVTGGGSQNDRLIARKRELGARPIEVAAHQEATALGAALLARRAWDQTKKPAVSLGLGAAPWAPPPAGRLTDSPFQKEDT